MSITTTFFDFFKMAAAAILDFLNFCLKSQEVKILLVIFAFFGKNNPL